MADRSVFVRLRADVSQFRREMAEASRSTNRLASDVDHAGESVDGFTRRTDEAGTSIDKFSGRLALMVQGLTAVAPAAISLTALAVPAMASLANVVGVTGVAVGTTMLAFHGLGDALKALDKAQLEPTAENLEKAQKAMDQLSPSARGLVMQLDAMEPIFDSLREAAGQDMFPGLQKGLTDAMAVAPQVRGILKEVGGAVGDLGEMTGESLASGKWNDFLNFLRAEVPPATISLGKSVGNLASAASQLWMAFAPLNSGVLDGLEDITNNIEGWATTLDDTAGFDKFMNYIDDVGPKAGEALGAIANALLQIGEAAAPLGGPTLVIIETLADAIAGIANSPIGTPLAALATGAATLSLLNKGLMQTKMLLAGLSVTGAGGAAGAAAGGGIGAYFQENAEQMRDAARTMRTEAGSIRSNLGTVVSSFGLAGAASERQRTRLNAATTGLRNFRTASVQMAGAAAGTIGPLAGMALAATDIDDKMGISNTAMLGLMGTMAGPWGAAIGAGVGGLLDLKASGDSANEAILTLNETIGKGDTSALTSQIAAAKKQMDDLGNVSGVGDLFGDLKGRASMNLNGGADAFKAQIAAAEEANKKLKEYEYNTSSAGMATNNLSQFMDQSYRAALREAGGIEGAIEAMQNMRKAALETADAELNYKSAILDANDAIKENGRNTDLNTRGGIANRRALDSLAGAWNGQSDAAKNAKGAMADARANFIRTAEAMGYGEQKARKLARQLMEIPSRVVTVLQTEDYASAKIAAIKSEIASIDRNVTVYVNVRKPNAGGMGPQVGGSADGSTIPGQRYPYGDKMLYMLAPGEEVISNRFGQADRNRPLLKRINAGGLADGGTAGDDGDDEKDPKKKRKKRVKQFIVLTETGAEAVAGLKLKNLSKAVDASQKAFDKSTEKVNQETQARDAVLDSFNTLANEIAQQFQTELFQPLSESVDVWRADVMGVGGVADPIQTMLDDIANGKQFQDLFNGLQGTNLISPEALSAAAKKGTGALSLLNNYTPEQMSQYSSLFQQRNQMSSQIGTNVAQNQYGSQLDQANATLQQGIEEQRITQTILREVKTAVNAVEAASNRGTQATQTLTSSAKGGHRSKDKGGKR